MATQRYPKEKPTDPSILDSDRTRPKDTGSTLHQSRDELRGAANPRDPHNKIHQTDQPAVCPLPFNPMIFEY